MHDGYMKWYDARPGGYIAQENGQPNIFVARRVIENAGLARIRKGQRVSYEVAVNAQGQGAVVNIKLFDNRA